MEWVRAPPNHVRGLVVDPVVDVAGLGGAPGRARRIGTVDDGLDGGARLSRYLQVFGAMLARDLLVLRRNAVTVLIGIVAQPLLFAFIFGYLLPRLGGLGGEGMGAAGSYPTVLLPGLLATVLITQSLTAVAGPLIVELANPDALRNRLLAPVPVWLPLVGRAVSGAVQALLATGLMFPVLLPLSFLGCVYYPYSALADLPWLRFVSLLDPVTYLSEALRAVLTPDVPHLPSAVVLPVLLGGALLAGYLGMLGYLRRTRT